MIIGLTISYCSEKERSKMGDDGSLCLSIDHSSCHSIDTHAKEGKEKRWKSDAGMEMMTIIIVLQGRVGEEKKMKLDSQLRGGREEKINR